MSAPVDQDRTADEVFASTPLVVDGGVGEVVDERVDGWHWRQVLLWTWPLLVALVGLSVWLWSGWVLAALGAVVVIVVVVWAWRARPGQAGRQRARPGPGPSGRGRPGRARWAPWNRARRTARARARQARRPGRAGPAGRARQALRRARRAVTGPAHRARAAAGRARQQGAGRARQARAAAGAAFSRRARRSASARAAVRAGGGPGRARSRSRGPGRPAPKPKPYGKKERARRKARDKDRAWRKKKPNRDRWSPDWAVAGTWARRQWERGLNGWNRAATVVGDEVRSGRWPRTFFEPLDGLFPNGPAHRRNGGTMTNAATISSDVMSADERTYRGLATEYTAQAEAHEDWAEADRRELAELGEMGSPPQEIVDRMDELVDNIGKHVEAEAEWRGKARAAAEMADRAAAGEPAN